MTSSVQLCNRLLIFRYPKMRGAKLRFPVSNGGIGVRSAGQVALPAFLSSVEASHQLVQQLLPVRIQHISGRNNADFINAVEEWKLRSGAEVIQQPSLQNKSAGTRHW